MLVLASQSLRRREILTQAGITHSVRVSGIDECRRSGEGPEEYVCRLAREKAAAVEAQPEEFVLAADTTVVAGDHVLEKPHSPADAARMLRILSGREHVVMTGVCLRRGAGRWEIVEKTKVRFTTLSEEEVLSYSNSGEPLDKAGGYAIQGMASRYIEGIEGCYFNVVGLPIARVYRLLRDAGYSFSRG